MESIKKTAEYEIIKKRSGRYGVRDARRNWVTGDEKVKILVEEKLIKAALPKAPEPEAPAEAQDTAAEAAPEEASEESAADAPAEAPAEETAD